MGRASAGERGGKCWLISLEVISPPASVGDRTERGEEGGEIFGY